LCVIQPKFAKCVKKNTVHTRSTKHFIVLSAFTEIFVLSVVKLMKINKCKNFILKNKFILKTLQIWLHPWKAIAVQTAIRLINSNNAMNAKQSCLKIILIK